jgi:hypothetical protein
VARAHEHATLRDEQRRPERDLVGAEQRGEHDVASRLEAAVDTHANAAAQAGRDELALRLGEPELPRQPGVLDRREGAGAGAAVCARDVDDVGERLRDTGRDYADAGLRDELHRDVRVWVDLAQVEDELREILDRVDVVVRRRRDQRDTRRRVPQACNLAGDLVPRKLAALAGLRALRHLDL